MSGSCSIRLVSGSFPRSRVRASVIWTPHTGPTVQQRTPAWLPPLGRCGRGGASLSLWGRAGRVGWLGHRRFSGWRAGGLQAVSLSWLCARPQASRPLVPARVWGAGEQLPPSTPVGEAQPPRSAMPGTLTRLRLPQRGLGAAGRARVVSWAWLFRGSAGKAGGDIAPPRAPPSSFAVDSALLGSGAC